MFGSRLLFNMACKSMCRPTFKVSQSFATMTPIYTETTTMLGKAISIPNNLLVRNLREMIMKAQQQMDLDMEINGMSQLTLLTQVTQTGLIKQSPHKI